MGMSYTLAELRKLSDDDLARKYDELVKGTSLQNNPNHFLQILTWREQDRQTQAMLRLTRSVAIMTVVIAIATVVNMVVLLR